jgi:predicted ribosomally synthesized peptide with nif11-like leader
MSRAELDRFFSDLDRDVALAQEFRQLAADLDAAVRWANARRYDFTREEVEARVHAGDLSDDDLDMVAGGWTGPLPPPPGG